MKYPTDIPIKKEHTIPSIMGTMSPDMGCIG